jgi:hypothetical protein
MSRDMSPAAITRRLRHVSRLFSTLPGESPRVAMSPEAITRRLREAASLHRLAVRLRWR